MPVGGQPGNKNATKNKPWSDAIAKFADQNPEKRDKVIEKLYEMAIDGNLLAIKEIIDRVDGKAMQAVSINRVDDLSEWPTETLWERYKELQHQESVLESEKAPI